MMNSRMSLVGIYRFDDKTGRHCASNLVTETGERRDGDNGEVVLNYFDSPSDHGFFNNEVIVVAENNGAYFTWMDTAKYPENRNRYFEIRSWHEFAESARYPSLEDWLNQLMPESLKLEPTFKFRSYTLVIESAAADGSKVYYSGFHATSDGMHYICPRDSLGKSKGRVEDWIGEDGYLRQIGVSAQGESLLLNGEQIRFYTVSARYPDIPSGFLSDSNLWELVKVKTLMATLADGPRSLDELASEFALPDLKSVWKFVRHDVSRVRFAFEPEKGRPVVGCDERDRDYWGPIWSYKVQEILHSDLAVGRLTRVRESIYALTECVCIDSTGARSERGLVPLEDVRGDVAELVDTLCIARRKGNAYILLGCPLSGTPEGAIGDFKMEDFKELGGGDRLKPKEFLDMLDRENIRELTPVSDAFVVDGHEFKTFPRQAVLSVGQWGLAGFTYNAEKRVYERGEILSDDTCSRGFWLGGLAAVWPVSSPDETTGLAAGWDGYCHGLLQDEYWEKVAEMVEEKRVLGQGRKESNTPPEERKFLDHLKEGSDRARLKFDETTLEIFHTCCKLQYHYGVLPVLEGPPGGGKSSLASLYGRVLCGSKAQPVKVFVSSGWSRPEDLVGWQSPLRKADEFDFCPAGNGFYEALKEAQDDLSKRQVVVFEEVNLSPPEFWFAEFLQHLSSQSDDRIVRNAPAGERSENPAESKLKVSENLLMVGTVNNDAVSHPLSDRFIDRSAFVYLGCAKGERQLKELVPVDWKELSAWIERSGIPPVSSFGPWMDKGVGFAEWGEEKRVKFDGKQAAFSNIDQVYNAVVSRLGVALGLEPSRRVDQNVKAYIANRPDLSGLDPMEAQLKALDEALAIFVMSHALANRSYDKSQLDALKDDFERVFGKDGLSMACIDRLLNE